MKHYVLDTNVLLSDDACLDKLCTEGNYVYIPIVCLEELDRHKGRSEEVGRNARSISRKMDEYRKFGNLQTGIALPAGGKLQVVSGDFSAMTPEGLDVTKVDNQIIGCTFYLRRVICYTYFENELEELLAKKRDSQQPREELNDVCQEVLAKNDAKIVLISRDINVRLKCDSVGVESEDYRSSHVTVTNKGLYRGVEKVLVEDDLVNTIYASKHRSLNQNDFFKGFYPNQIIVVKNQNTSQSVIVRVVDPAVGSYKIVDDFSKKKVYTLQPKNKEQGFALELLMDPEITLVTLAGTAGCGKTLLAIAAGLQLQEDNKYDKVIITRPIEPVGRDIGFLPGSTAAKMAPWVAPIRDNLEYLFYAKKPGTSDAKSKKSDFSSGMPSMSTLGEEPFSKDPRVNHLIMTGKIEVEAVTFIRGRSFPRSFIIVDEAQNLNIHQLKTIITRSGEGSKIVLTGDLTQIDVAQMDALSSGFTHCIEKFKEHSVAGHITLEKGERSKLATLAAEIL